MTETKPCPRCGRPKPRDGYRYCQECPGEHDYLHERFDRLHTTSAAVALMDFHAEHGCDRKTDVAKGL